ncbi:MAG TPA: winged helix-turn-helix domain-containing protein [bacterium]|nr:winged helix-turn-helix domain-containing protein [bacterium]HPT29481.1 winged helix-turn-helix domain-containing protein [bacterium]
MLDLRSNTINRVLNYFFLNPDSRCYLSSLARTLKMDPGNLSKKLMEMEEEKILFSEVEGRQKYFKLNKDYPLLDEIKKIQKLFKF